MFPGDLVDVEVVAEPGGDLAWGQREAAERDDCGDCAFPGGELPFEAPKEEQVWRVGNAADTAELS